MKSSVADHAHAGQRLGRRGVGAAQRGAERRGAQHAAVQHAVGAQVRREALGAGDHVARRRPPARAGPPSARPPAGSPARRPAPSRPGGRRPAARRSRRSALRRGRPRSRPPRSGPRRAGRTAPPPPRAAARARPLPPRAAAAPRTASTGCRRCPGRTGRRRCRPSPRAPSPAARRAPRRPAAPSAVRVPWPASTLPVKAVTEPSAPTCTQASSGPPHRPWPGAAAASPSSATTVTRPSGSCVEERGRVPGQIPRQRPGAARRAAAAPDVGRRHRLEQLRLLHELGRAADRAPDPRIGAAPADVPGQLGGDPGVIRVRSPG